MRICIYNRAQNPDVLRVSVLLCNWCYSFLNLANCTHWPINSDSIDYHPSCSYHNYQKISVTQCKKSYLEILSRLKWWNGIDNDKKKKKKKKKECSKFRINDLCRLLTWWLECSPMAPETWVQSQVESYQRLKKMVLDFSLLNTQHYKVRIKGKVA